MPLAAIELLDASCPIKAVWAVFDSIWYLKTYQAHLPTGLPRTPQALLGYYVQSGCRAGHSPSYFFDERFYLSDNPDVASLVEVGHFRSGFDHFCQHGHRDRSPHWLFDDTHYKHLYEDMTLENLEANKFHGRYDHYLGIGQHEHRSAHLLFDSRFYQMKASAAGDDAAAIQQQGPFTHYLARLNSDAAELPPSAYFDPAWYLENQQGVMSKIAEEGLGSAIEHYLNRRIRDPVAEFSEPFYLDANPDVRHGIESGIYRNGYHHFIQRGVFELRRPNANIDLATYRNIHERVRNDLNSGQVRDAFAHLRLIGNKIGLSAEPLRGGAEISETATKELFIQKARANLMLFARGKLSFTFAGQPVLSVVMIIFEKFELTMLSLGALRDNYPGPIELIIIDNASTDDSRRIGDYVEGAKITLLTKNIGYLLACNLGLQQATSLQVLFLNNDIELGHGAIGTAIARLQSDPRIGAVGGKVIRTHGKLQEAGSIIWRDGTVTGYMRDAPPLAPEANFVRDVDFCSGVFLLCRAGLVEKLGGFDADYSPAYYEDVDLCMRIAAAGYRIVYDPGIVIHHLEYGSASNIEASMTLMRRGRQTLIRKHEQLLQQKYELSAQNTIFARSPGVSRKNILFVEDRIPLHWLGSGYGRASDVVHAIAAAGHHVSVFPINRAHRDIISMFGAFADDIEILYDREVGGLAELLETRCGYYDAIWISRTHNLDRILPILQQSSCNFEQTPLILDTEAIFTLRDAARAAVTQSDFKLAAKLRAEFASAAICRHVVAVSQLEADLLGSLGFATTVLGTQRDPQPTPNPFSARENMLFVAAIHQPDSPNLDALCWYADEILPALTLQMQQVPLLNVVGYIGPDIDLSRFAGHPHIRINGPAADLRPYYNQSRLFIAPTRFAAGTPYKLYETASFGLPCVTTNLLAGQLGWRDGVELLAGPATDAKKFATQIAHLYRCEPSWTELRRNALARITTENTLEHFNATVAQILNRYCTD